MCLLVLTVHCGCYQLNIFAIIDGVQTMLFLTFPIAYDAVKWMKHCIIMDNSFPRSTYSFWSPFVAQIVGESVLILHKNTILTVSQPYNGKIPCVCHLMVYICNWRAFPTLFIQNSWYEWEIFKFVKNSNNIFDFFLIVFNLLKSVYDLGLAFALMFSLIILCTHAFTY